MSKVWAIGLVVIALGVAVAFVVLEPRVAAPQLAGVPLAEVPCCVICTPVGTTTQVPVATSTPSIAKTPTRTVSPVEIRCSMKKGVSTGTLSGVAEGTDMLYRAGVSWFYDWTTGSNDDWAISKASGIEFVPMLRVELELHKTQILHIINARGYRGYWLIGNEPNNSRPAGDQLNFAEAAEAYGKILYYIRGFDPTAKFILPGLVESSSWWIRKLSDAWLARWGELPPVAGWSVHLYAVPKSGETIGAARDRLLNNLKGFINDHPGKEIWVTEFGELLTKNRQIISETMVRFGNAMELMGVDRYAFFWLGSVDNRDWDYTSLYEWRDEMFWETPLLTTYALVVPTVEIEEPCE